MASWVLQEVLTKLKNACQPLITSYYTSFTTFSASGCTGLWGHSFICTCAEPVGRFPKGRQHCMKKLAFILGAILLATAGVYLYLRFSVLKAKDFKPETVQSRSPLDLRPALIAKLKQMVRDGSAGLYQLDLDDIEVQVGTSTVELRNATLRVDSANLKHLDSLHLIPDNLYRISLHKLHIEGLGLSELVNSRVIDLDKISVSGPQVSIYHNPKSYNKAQRRQDDSTTLYQSLTKHASHIAISNIMVEQGTLRTFNAGHIAKNLLLTGIRIAMKNILIDSSTQFDRSRFLFATNAILTTGRLERRTADSLYIFRTEKLTLDAAANQLTAQGIALLPRGSKSAFQHKLKYRSDRFDLSIPRMVMHGMNWRALLTDGSVTCSSADLYGGHLSDYVNDALPPRPRRSKQNFPYQIVYRLSQPLNIKQVAIHGMEIAYTEFYPPSGQEGTLAFNNVNATISNVINERQHIGSNMWCSVKARTRFMGSIPLRINFSFDMNRPEQGTFTAQITGGPTNTSVINPVTEALALFTIKDGTLDSLHSKLEGDNNIATANVKLGYHNLHINPLKKKEDGGIKKKKFLGFIANALIIKNENPGKDFRNPIVSVDRDGSSSFFNFCWRALRLGIFKTIGLPESLAPK